MVRNWESVDTVAPGVGRLEKIGDRVFDVNGGMIVDPVSVNNYGTMIDYGDSLRQGYAFYEGFVRVSFRLKYKDTTETYPGTGIMLRMMDNIELFSVDTGNEEDMFRDTVIGKGKQRRIVASSDTASINRYLTTGLWVRGRDIGSIEDQKYFLRLYPTRMPMQCATQKIPIDSAFTLPVEDMAGSDVEGKIVDGAGKSILKMEAINAGGTTGADTLSDIQNPEIVLHHQKRKVSYNSDYLGSGSMVQFQVVTALEDSDAGKKWIDGAFEILFGALPQSFIIDWDSTVTTRYGEQEGVEVGYNPAKPGRGSHHPLIATVAGLRMCLTLSQRPGNSHTADGMTAAMDDLLSRLPANRRPYITRADIGFSGEPTLKWFEAGSDKPYYVFKLKKSSKVMEAVRAVSEKQWDGAASFGAMQITEQELQLTTWEKKRRIILGRRLVNKQTPEESGTLFGVCAYEYSAFVTNLSKDQFATWQIVELYQGRADCENVFDELKNQWGLSGFCSQQMHITEMAARFTVLSYNVWSLFARFFGGKQHKEAQTSRREILMFPAQLTESGRERTLQISVADQFWDIVNLGYERLVRWLKATAPQLTCSCALVDWIKTIEDVSSSQIPDLSTAYCGK